MYAAQREMRKKTRDHHASAVGREQFTREKFFLGGESPAPAIDADAGAALLAWYRRHRRSLPWRRTTDPYAILVSEIMLQQTRVETVIPYYERFLAAFSDIDALARAPLDAVLAQWSGLGYYTRARRLHRAARAIVAAGAFPRTARELRALPGIGAYTAAAVASIAFGESTAVVDGNVERVIARLLDLDTDPGRGAGRRHVRATAALLLDEGSPGDGNQALMELGALVCRPRQPLCPRCPLASACAAHARGRVGEVPVATPRRAGVRERRIVAVARRADRFLLVRNHEGSELLAGLWEFPWVVRRPSRAAWEVSLGERYGGSWRVGVRLGSARHALTFRSLELDVREADVRFEGDAVAERSGMGEPGWLSLAEIAAVPTTSMVQKVLARVDASSG